MCVYCVFQARVHFSHKAPCSTHNWVRLSLYYVCLLCVSGQGSPQPQGTVQHTQLSEAQPVLCVSIVCFRPGFSSATRHRAAPTAQSGSAGVRHAARPGPSHEHSTPRHDDCTPTLTTRPAVTGGAAPHVHAWWCGRSGPRQWVDLCVSSSLLTCQCLYVPAAPHPERTISQSLEIWTGFPGTYWLDLINFRDWLIVVRILAHLTQTTCWTGSQGIHKYLVASEGHCKNIGVMVIKKLHLN